MFLLFDSAPRPVKPKVLVGGAAALTTCAKQQLTTNCCGRWGGAKMAKNQKVTSETCVKHGRKGCFVVDDSWYFIIIPDFLSTRIYCSEVVMHQLWIKVLKSRCYWGSMQAHGLVHPLCKKDHLNEIWSERAHMSWCHCWSFINVVYASWFCPIFIKLCGFQLTNHRTSQPCCAMAFGRVRVRRAGALPLIALLAYGSRSFVPPPQAAEAQLGCWPWCDTMAKLSTPRIGFESQL